MAALSKSGWALVAASLVTPALYFLVRQKSNSEAGSGTVTFPQQVSTALNNLRAFLLTLQFAEGTIGDHAYRMLYGGSTFNSYANHPNRAISKWGITSTAAGAYQFLYGTWTDLQYTLALPDFSPDSQDKAAVELIRRKGALPDIAAGYITSAIYKCRKVWASLPGAGYGQGEKAIDSLLQMYRSAGGQLVS